MSRACRGLCGGKTSSFLDGTHITWLWKLHVGGFAAPWRCGQEVTPDLKTSLFVPTGDAITASLYRFLFFKKKKKRLINPIEKFATWDDLKFKITDWPQWVLGHIRKAKKNKTPRLNLHSDSRCISVTSSWKKCSRRWGFGTRPSLVATKPKNHPS